MCALMLTLRHPDTFGTFADFSGLAGPRAGNTNDPAGTVSGVFGGSRAAFLAHEPARLLAGRRFPGLAGWFEVGGSDGPALRAARTLAPAARRAGIAVHLVVVPGAGHTFTFWSRALRDALPWLVARVERHARHPRRGILGAATH
jgi:S-formylglutathione hydrolase FrmB